MAAYYNEFDPYAAQWLRNLITAGHIAPGVVDERSIEDVHPSDLRGFEQCHFFAGIGVWSLALRRAGWPDDRPVWTGSCPCQPFSQAGEGAGFDDERHLWPHFQWLISERRPPVIFGEQVASRDAGPWIDLVQDDLEGLGYGVGAVAFPSAGVGAPHIRDRLYWMAHASGKRRSGRQGISPGRVDDWANAGRWQGDDGLIRRNQAGVLSSSHLGNPQRKGLALGERIARVPCGAGGTDAGQALERAGVHAAAGPCPTNGFWGDADWLFCRDGKWRPVEPSFQQMADGSSASLGRVCPRAIEEAEGEVNDWAIRHQADPSEALRRVWRGLRAQALCERETGRFSGVQSPAVLLSFMRQLAEQGWRFSDALACEGTGTPQAVVRILRFDPCSARTPLRRELAEQLAGEPADPLRELSSIVAHHAAQCWGEACRQKTGAASFPLAHGAPARVGRLRAYGNAINAQQAQIFIEAAMSCMP